MAAKKEKPKKTKTDKAISRYPRLTLDQIETKMIELIEGLDRNNYFMNTKKLEALNMVAQQKLKRAELESKLTTDNKNIVVEPIKVEFVSNDTETERINRLTQEVEEALGGGKIDCA